MTNVTFLAHSGFLAETEDALLLWGLRLLLDGPPE